MISAAEYKICQPLFSFLASKRHNVFFIRHAIHSSCHEPARPHRWPKSFTLCASPLEHHGLRTALPWTPQHHVHELLNDETQSDATKMAVVAYKLSTAVPRRCSRLPETLYYCKLSSCQKHFIPFIRSGWEGLQCLLFRLFFIFFYSQVVTNSVTPSQRFFRGTASHHPDSGIP